jgi:lipopolysaccharide biosynthesis glycosyltransferase
LSLSIFVLCKDTDPTLPSVQYSPLFVGREGPFNPSLQDRLPLVDGSWSGLALQNRYLDLADEPGGGSEVFLNRAAIARYALDQNIDTPSPAALVGQAIHIDRPLKEYLSQRIAADDLAVFLSLLSNEQQGVCQQLLARRELPQPIFFAPAAVVTRVFELWGRAIGALTARADLTLGSIRALEPLLGVLVAIILEEGELPAHKRPTVSFSNTSVPLSLKRWKGDSFAVVFAANEGFAPALAVCINSLLHHISDNNSYDIVVLESEITEGSKARLALLCSQYPNVKLRFFNPLALLDGYELKKNPNDHISMETYYRFLISDVLPEYERVLYLDGDTVILDDVATLATVELGDNLLAAALDAEIPALRSGVDPTMARYLEQALGLGAEDPYLQAGVLVLNLDQMRRYHSVQQWLDLASQRRYRYNDQDILNKECKGRFVTLPMEWNTVVNCNNRRLPTIEKGPYAVYAAYMEAREHPKIIHYAGFEKPWDAVDSDYAHYFWHYATDSGFYDRLLVMVEQSRSSANVTLGDRLFPRGSRRRRLIKGLVYRTRGR